MLKIAGATFEKTPFLYLQDIGSKAILSSQLGICAVTCVSMMNTLIIILWRVINVVICLNMILPGNMYPCMMIISAQTIAPGGFCSIGGKPKPCKLLVKLKEKARAQVESFGSWLQDNNPSHQSVTWIKLSLKQFLWDMTPEFQKSVIQKDLTCFREVLFDILILRTKICLTTSLLLGTIIIKIFIHNFSFTEIGAIKTNIQIHHSRVVFRRVYSCWRKSHVE